MKRNEKEYSEMLGAINACLPDIGPKGSDVRGGALRGIHFALTNPDAELKPVQRSALFLWRLNCDAYEREHGIEPGTLEAFFREQMGA